MRLISRSSSGFTILELMVAISVFAVLSLLTFQVIMQSLQSQQQLEEEMQKTEGLQNAFFWLKQDFTQAIARTSRLPSGRTEAAFLLTNTNQQPTLRFTRAGWGNPQGLPRSNLVRIQYILDQKGHLRRSYWLAVDRTRTTPVREDILLSGVRKMQVRVLDTQNRWQSQWNPIQDNELNTIPCALEIKLTIDGWGEIPRIFALPCYPQ